MPAFKYMGLSLPSLRYIICEHKRKPFEGPIITLGRQCVYGTYQEVLDLFRQEKIKPHELPTGMSLTTNIPLWQNTARAQNTSDVVFFRLLTGKPVFALDSSAYEGAEYIWDLNKPISHEWYGKFGTVIDSGTLEHLFDVKQAMWNINNLVTKEGRIIHMSPANNYMEHGFYQFSPTFFYDYYGTNGFVDLHCNIAEQLITHIDHGKWNFWKWNTKRPYVRVASSHMLALYFSAQKTLTSTSEKIPQQGQFLTVGDAGKTQGSTIPAWQQTLAEILPPWLIVTLKRIMGTDLTVKPWGLKYRGKL